MSWIRVPLGVGTLKVKPRRHLRRDELDRKVPVIKLGSAYIVWRRKRPASVPASE